MKEPIGAKQLKVIDGLVDHFISNRHLFETLLSQLNQFVENSEELKNVVHTIKRRVKDPEHLRDKLIRKVREAKKNGKPFSITKQNLFIKINDLAGFRILHLYTHQIEKINTGLQHIFDEQRWVLREKPSARTWDDESRAYFKQVGIEVKNSPNMYTSVHYVIQPNSRTKITCEIQVRTLMEEVWGEVDHSINYPHKADSTSCQEQIKVLARMTSSCSRLVDSIFKAYDEFHEIKPKKENKLASTKDRKIKTKGRS